VATTILSPGIRSRHTPSTNDDITVVETASTPHSAVSDTSHSTSVLPLTRSRTPDNGKHEIHHQPLITSRAGRMGFSTRYGSQSAAAGSSVSSKVPHRSQNPESVLNWVFISLHLLSPPFLALFIVCNVRSYHFDFARPPCIYMFPSCHFYHVLLVYVWLGPYLMSKWQMTLLASGRSIFTIIMSIEVHILSSSHLIPLSTTGIA
jgi:hypothetical protein